MGASAAQSPVRPGARLGREERHSCRLEELAWASLARVTWLPPTPHFADEEPEARKQVGLEVIPGLGGMEGWNAEIRCLEPGWRASPPHTPPQAG